MGKLIENMTLAELEKANPSNDDLEASGRRVMVKVFASRSKYMNAKDIKALIAAGVGTRSDLEEASDMENIIPVIDAIIESKLKGNA